MRVAVAGAGIAGLTAALALARDGAEVVVAEAAPALSEAGAGLQLSPNATRALRALGLFDAVARMGLRPEAVHVRRARDGATLARMPLGAEAEARYGAPFLLAHRADLQTVLHRAVVAEPRVALRLGTRVADVTERNGDGLRLRLASGDGEPETLDVDALVGADGLHSPLRALVDPGAPDPLRFSGRLAWRALVPAGAAPAFALKPDSALWLGRRTHLVHYPLRGGSVVNLVAITEDAKAVAGSADGSAVPGDPRRLGAAFGDWCAEARALLDAAPAWRVWPLFERRALRRWHRGAVVLAGDAAHPMLPFLAQGAAQAIEDGAALAAALRAGPSVAAAAAAYEGKRRARAERVVAESRRQGLVYHLAPLPARARDAAFALLGPSRMLRRFDWLYGA